MKTLGQLKILVDTYKHELLKEASRSIIPWIENRIILHLKHDLLHFDDGRLVLDLPIQDTYTPQEQELIQIFITAQMIESGWQVARDCTKVNRITLWWHKDDS